MSRNFHIWKICKNSLFLIILFVGIASIIGIIFQKMQFLETNIVIIYILFVLLSARLTNGYIYGVISAIISTAAYNYLFTVPYFTFQVEDFGYIVTFIIMTITAIITSTLTSRVKQNVLLANQKEMEMRILYQLTSHLLNAENIHEIAKISVERLYNLFKCKVGFLCFDEKGIPEKLFVQQISEKKQIYREIDNGMDIKYKFEVLRDKYISGDEFFDYPLYGRNEILGVLRLQENVARNLDSLQIKLLHTIMYSISLAMDRLIEEEKRLKSKEEVIQERYRANLLRSISHDLRTPLSGIMGMAEILMDIGKEDSHIYSISCDIYQDANWLKSLMENILSLTKLQEGKLVIYKQYETVEDLIGSAVGYFKRGFFENKIIVDLPEQLILVEVDAKLIVQVLINLIDNAIKHSKPEDDIFIKVKYLEMEKEVEISVIDKGEGIAKEDLPNIFQEFYTSNSKITDSTKGIGLGLSICEAIIHAHGGTIVAENRKDSCGAILKFKLLAEVKEYEQL